MYKPLPETVAVKESPIHGYGLFAIADIPTRANLGISHVFAVGFKDNYIRTPLGGFINHSNTPNCVKVELLLTDFSFRKKWNLMTAQDIKKGDEVIVPDLTFVASPNSIEAVGAKPILVDIDDEQGWYISRYF